MPGSWIVHSSGMCLNKHLGASVPRLPLPKTLHSQILTNPKGDRAPSSRYEGAWEAALSGRRLEWGTLAPGKVEVS